MTLEELQELLKSGVLTQEQFDKLKENAKPSESAEPTEPTKPTEPTEPDEPKASEPIDLEKLDKIIQSRVDKATAKLGKEKAELKKQLERIQKAKLTDDELKQIEIDERERTIAEREKEVTDKENRLYAVKAIKEAGLDDGSDTSLALVDFVMGEDEAAINDKVKAFKDLFTKAVNKEVDKRFKRDSYIPPKGSTALNDGKNPYSKEQWNLTDQITLETSNPELAKQLMAAAGVK